MTLRKSSYKIIIRVVVGFSTSVPGVSSNNLDPFSVSSRSKSKSTIALLTIPVVVNPVASMLLSRAFLVEGKALKAYFFRNFFFHNK